MRPGFDGLGLRILPVLGGQPPEAALSDDVYPSGARPWRNHLRSARKASVAGKQNIYIARAFFYRGQYRTGAFGGAPLYRVQTRTGGLPTSASTIAITNYMDYLKDTPPPRAALDKCLRGPHLSTEHDVKR